MITKYTYDNHTFDNLYTLSEYLGSKGIFIPLDISEDNLSSLGVTITHEEYPLETLKEQKLYDLKATRDDAEVEPISYQGYSFDYDSKARERINAAIIALESAGSSATLTWTTADNQDVKVTAANLRGVVAAVAARSNALHIAYRKAKAQVEQATTIAEVEAITLGV